MQVNLTIHITYDRAKDGGLQDFFKKYHQFRGHIANLQARGHLPQGEVRYSVKKAVPQVPPDAPKAGEICALPVPVHCAGTPLRIQSIDPDRIAM